MHHHGGILRQLARHRVAAPWRPEAGQRFLRKLSNSSVDRACNKSRHRCISAVRNTQFPAHDLLPEYKIVEVHAVTDYHDDASPQQLT